jgi:hypothetical protein
MHSKIAKAKPSLGTFGMSATCWTIETVGAKHRAAVRRLATLAAAH